MRQGPGPSGCSAAVNTQKCSRVCARATGPWQPVSPVRACSFGPRGEAGMTGWKNASVLWGGVFQDDERGCACNCQSISAYFPASQFGMAKIAWRNCWYSLWSSGAMNLWISFHTKRIIKESYIKPQIFYYVENICKAYVCAEYQVLWALPSHTFSKTFKVDW